MSKPSLSWVRRARGASRFSVPHKLLLDGKEIGEFYYHEEDGSASSVDEVLTLLAKHGAIEYEPLFEGDTNG